MQNSNDKSPEALKVVLLGDSTVGKTSLRYKYIGKEFESDLMPTLGVDFSLQDIKFNDKNIKLQIWDVGGQPTYSQIRKSFYGGSHAGIVMYDIKNRISFENVRHWIEEFLKHCGFQNTVVIVVANKIDLRIEDNNDMIMNEDGIELVKSLAEDFKQDIPFYETSALTGENIKAIFENICRYYLSKE